ERRPGERVDVRAWQMAGAEQVADKPASAGAADLSRSHVAAQQDKAGLLRRVDDPLEAGVDGGEQVAKTADATGLVGDELAPAPDQQPQLDVDLACLLDRPQVAAGTYLIGDHPRIPRVALVLVAACPLSSPVDGEPRDVHERVAGLGEHRA